MTAETFNFRSEDRIITEVAHGSAEYWATVELRDLILRKPLGLKFSATELEAEKNSRHIACYRDIRLVGCLVLRPHDREIIQMRQLAVAADLQKQGIGKDLVQYADAMARTIGYRRMILHARESAVAFYENLGYSRLGNRFEEATLPHWEMAKDL